MMQPKTAQGIRLSARLRAVADFVPHGARAADIGADHGYLSIWLAQSGRAAGVVAVELRPGPLEKARANLAKAGPAARRVSLRLGDGLCALSPHEADCVIIAGMGGETIAAILDAAPWCAAGACALVLQPMSKAEELRRFLARRGFRISRERLVRENGVIYCVLCARGGAPAREPEPWELYIGPALLESGDALLPEYLALQRKRLERAAAGAARSDRESDKPRLAAFSAALARLSEKGEDEHADGA